MPHAVAAELVSARMSARHLSLLVAVLVLAACGGEDEPTAPAQRAEPTQAERVARDEQSACQIFREPDAARLVLRTTGRRLEEIGKPEVERMDSEETSSCGYYAGRQDDVAIKLIVDRAAQSQKRYWYRLEELNQRSDNWSGPDPRLVFGIGQDKTYGGAGAFWNPSLSKLIAWRDDTMLTIIFFVPEVNDRESSRAAASLAKTAYRRLFGDRRPAPVRSLQGRAPHP